MVIWSFFQLPKLNFNYDIERFFPNGDPDLEHYNTFRKAFLADDNFIFISIANKDGIFNREFLNKLDSFSNECSKIPGVEQSLAISNLKYPLKTTFGLMQFDVFDLENQTDFVEDSLRLVSDPRIKGSFLSHDLKHTNVMLFTEAFVKQSSYFPINEKLAQLERDFNFDEVHIVGKVNTVSTIIKMIRSELFLYTGISSILILILLIIIYRRLPAVLYAFTSVVLGLIIFMGLLAWWGQPIDILSALFPILMLVVGMSDIVHIMTKHHDELKKGKTNDEAVWQTVKEIGFATLLTSLTTGIGFASLASASIIPIREFGLTAALGVFVAYLTVMLFTVSLLRIRPPWGAKYKKSSGDFWHKWMDRCYHFTLKNGRLIAGFSVLLFFICLYGIFQISTDTSILGDVSAKDRVRKDFSFFEENYNGVRQYEVMLFPQEGIALDDYSFLNELNKFDQYIQSNEIFGHAVSPLTLYASLNVAYNSNKIDYYYFPENSSTIKKYNRDLRLAGENLSGTFISKDKSMARYSCKVKDLGANTMKDLYKEIRKWADKNLDAEIIKIQQTGSAVMIDKNNILIRRALFSGLGIAFVLISLLMSFLFRDFRLIVISIIPNIFPLLVAGAVMGFAGIELKASTSIIFTLAFGIAVDDTIHLLTKLKLELSKGLSREEALKNALHETGKAICITSIILFFGFLSLLFSSFVGTYYVGLLVSITLFSAVLADLIIAPVFIRMLMKE